MKEHRAHHSLHSQEGQRPKSMDSLIANSGSQGICTLDFSDFLHGDHAARSKFAKDLVDCLDSVGFVKLKNHGITDGDIRRVFDIVRFLSFSTSLAF